WFALLGTALEALDAGATLLVDELDATLHPTISTEVILLNDDRVLDRDTVRLAEKDAEGGTEAVSLDQLSAVQPIVGSNPQCQSPLPGPSLLMSPRGQRFVGLAPRGVRQTE